MNLKYPYFIGIGGHRCGTTWFFENLKNINNLKSLSKETHFFSRHFDHGFNWYFNEITAKDLEQPFCEFSTSYLYDYNAPKRIKKYFPKTKIIVILRNPIYRFYSHYKHEIYVGHNTLNDLKNSYIMNPSYFELGNYFPYLERWLNFYSKDEICVILFDDILDNSLAIFNKVQSFLGFDTLSQSNRLTSSTKNISMIPKNRMSSYIHFSIKNILKNNFFLKYMFPQKLRKTFKKKIEKKILTQIPFNNDDFNFVKEKYLTHQMKINFEKLSLLIDRDLQDLWFRKHND